MVKYTVVNPFMVGSFQTTYEGASALDAAKNFWGKFSSQLTNNLPSFSFTMQEDGSKKLSHFNVKEEMEGGKVNFVISEKILTLTDAAVDKLNKEIDSLKTQYGGRRHREEDDSSSSSDTDEQIIKKFNKMNKLRFNHLNSPIVYFRYFPGLYAVDDVYIPTFITPVIPYVEVNFSTAFWY